MKRLFLGLVLTALLPGPVQAVSLGTAEYGTIAPHPRETRPDQCQIKYYDFCSGWVFHWNSYCFAGFNPISYPPLMYGTCFDLTDCPLECRHLEDVWWACWTFNWLEYAAVDVEIYCADTSNCPIGPPLAGFYSYHPDLGLPYWQRFDFGGLPLCSCEQGEGAGKFIVMITDYTAPFESQPYSDLNGRNIDDGCENEWRCGGTHSFVYRNVVTYCDVYGVPGPLWWHHCADCGCTNYPTIPPGCHNYYFDTGYYCEWLIDCYLACEGPTETKKETWSGVKSLYR
jgi:hypothetical protein